MTTTPACESCDMPIETGRYCGHCTDESGQLHSFDQRQRTAEAQETDCSPAQEAWRGTGVVDADQVLPFHRSTSEPPTVVRALPTATQLVAEGQETL